jgi:hypothetical protein
MSILLAANLTSAQYMSCECDPSEGEGPTDRACDEQSKRQGQQASLLSIFYSILAQRIIHTIFIEQISGFRIEHDASVCRAVE